MAWTWKTPSSWAYSCFFYLVKHGDLPQHVAVIMDGNRTFGRSQNWTFQQIYEKGLRKVKEVAKWCVSLGVPEYSIYAFSVENFRRGELELKTLFNLLRRELVNLINHREILHTNGIRIRAVGKITLFPDDIIALLTIVERISMRNNKLVLNVFLCYTTDEELVDISYYFVKAVREGKISSDEIDFPLFDECLYTYRSPYPDIIIRTSGLERMSRYLTWQGTNTYLCYPKPNWPQLSALDMTLAMFHYQYFRKQRPKVEGKKKALQPLAQEIQEARRKEVLARCPQLKSLSEKQMIDYVKIHFKDLYGSKDNDNFYLAAC